MKSAIELNKTPEGRKYLEKQRKRHWKDILQPSDKLYSRVYGEKHRKMEKDRLAQEKASEGHNEEIKAKKQWERKQL